MAPLRFHQRPVRALKRWLPLLFLLSLCTGLVHGGHAQTPPETPPQTQEEGPLPPVQSRLFSDRTPLFWADGITKIDDLDAYKAEGFNVVVVHLTWTPSTGGEISAADLAPQRAFALQAARRGLKVIYSLPAAPDGMESEFRLAADSDAYVSLWTAWLQDAMQYLRNTPNLIGWMLPDDPRGLAIFDDNGFRRWLAQNYAGIEVINRQWNSAFNSMDDVSIADIAQLSGQSDEPQSLSPDDFNKEKAQIIHSGLAPNLAFHPAGLALAQYKWDAYRSLMATWIGAVRGEDSSHLVFSGRTPDYAQLLSLPAGIDVAVPDISPEVAESDIVTHNPQAIDISRRGGKFGVWPVLSPETAADLPASALPDLTRRWVDEACARGARGVGFTSWQGLADTPGLSGAVKEEISKLTQSPYLGLWGARPVNTTAVLLTPLADGMTLQYGTPPNQAPRGLYGFGENLVSGEPTNLVWSLRWGTAFGGIDYLSPDDLAEASLDQYTTILAPQALSATTETAALLTGYVANGGVLVADLGMAAVQNGGQANALTPPLATLFGLPDRFDIRPINFNLNGVTSHPLFPSWERLIETRPGVSVTMGDGPSNAAFVGPTGLGQLPPSSVVLATGPRIGQDFGPIKRILSAQLTLNSVGRGCAIFAPFRLWTYWRPGFVGFDTFHGDLFSRGATVVMAGAASVVPSPATANLGATGYPEIENRANGITLTNHNAPGGLPLMSSVQTAGAGDWLWGGAIAHFPSAPNASIVGGRLPPINNPTDFESRSRPVVLYCIVAPGEMRALTMRPISLQNMAGGPIAAQILEEVPRHLRVSLWPNSPTVVSNGIDWQPGLGDATPVRLTVVSSQDGYRFTPGSRHRVQVIDYSKTVGKNKYQTTVNMSVANAQGRLVIEFSGAACSVDITPIPSPVPSPVPSAVPASTQ